MNDMDEITYWVYTKRAPCLMNYDNLIKKQNEASQVPKVCKSDRSVTEDVPSPKKKKRKLSLLEEDVMKQANFYFEASQNKDRTVLSSCKSDTAESDIDFNINRPRKLKGQRNGQNIHKKNKVVTSTPLRRSLRNTQNWVNNEQLNASYEISNSEVPNGVITSPKLRTRKSLTKTQRGSAALDNKKETVQQEQPKNDAVLNGRFEDLSDVSGFTANYIRSTKLHNSKPHRSLRSRGSRNLSRQPSQGGHHSSMLLCVNKAVNATSEIPQHSQLNSSADAQNIILITTKNNNKKNKVNKSTSLLKFVDAKVRQDDSNIQLDNSKSISKTDMEISLQNPRYPRRLKKQSRDVTMSSCQSNLKPPSPSKRKAASRDVVEANSSHRKENPTDSSVIKTRSGRNLTLTLRHPENAVVVYSNSTERASSLNTLNVAGDVHTKLKVNQLSCKNVKKSMDKSVVSLQKDSVREKSGFAACFSDSDDEGEALKQRKYFC